MKIYCNGKEVELDEGSRGIELANALNQREPHQALALVVGDNTFDLNTPLSDGDEVSLLDFESKEGKALFWHSSAHVLAQAVLRLYPEAIPTIGPAIENGFYYDFANLSISEDDFGKIEKEIKKILSENARPVRSEFTGKEEALEAFADNTFKQEIIEGFEEGSPITAYKQDDFFDLCRGPHLPSIGKIKAFKLLKTSGAYWRADAKNAVLTRIYGISFPSRAELKEHLHFLAEAKKRDHRVIGNKLSLFGFKEEAPGMPFIYPKGMQMWNTLLAFWREVHNDACYEEILTPQMMHKDLWIRSGHWDHYRENMYTSVVEEREFAIKPMNCPGCMLYYLSKKHSYRDLPLRIAEVGHVHRHEASGALSGLFRVRSFHQDDAHHFMRPEQIKDEILLALKLADKLYQTFGLSYRLELSTRPDKAKTIGSDEQWDVATEGLRSALEAWEHPYKVNEGDGAFYGPKIDIHIKDAIGRSWQCGTIQLDMSLPERFDLNYRDADGGEKRPIMIHRALFGSIERFFGILVEHFAGKFPLWLSPRPVRIITVADRHLPYALEIKEAFTAEGFSVEVDDSPESVSKKVRTAQMEQVNYMITIGDNECDNKTIALRTRDNVVHGEMTLSALLAKMCEERDTRALYSEFKKEEVAK